MIERVKYYPTRNISRRDFLRDAVKAVGGVFCGSYLPEVKVPDLAIPQRIESANPFGWTEAETEQAAQSLATAYAQGWPITEEEKQKSSPEVWRVTAKNSIDYLNAISGADFYSVSRDPLVVSRAGKRLSEEDFIAIMKEYNEKRRAIGGEDDDPLFGPVEYQALKRVEIQYLNPALILSLAVAENGGEWDWDKFFVNALVGYDVRRMMNDLSLRNNYPERHNEPREGDVESGWLKRQDVDDLCLTLRIFGSRILPEKEKTEVKVFMDDGVSLNIKLFVPHYNINEKDEWRQRFEGVYRELQHAVKVNKRLGILFENIL